MHFTFNSCEERRKTIESVVFKTKRFISPSVKMTSSCTARINICLTINRVLCVTLAITDILNILTLWHSEWIDDTASPGPWPQTNKVLLSYCRDNLV